MGEKVGAGTEAQYATTTWSLPVLVPVVPVALWTAFNTWGALVGLVPLALLIGAGVVMAMARPGWLSGLAGGLVFATLFPILVAVVGFTVMAVRGVLGS